MRTGSSADRETTEAVATTDLPAVMPDAGEVTVWLKGALSGDADAMDRVMRQMYAALRQIARQQLAGEYQPRTIGATELVNESFLRLFGGNTMPRLRSEERRVGKECRPRWWPYRENIRDRR